jgi:aspartyl-tRNA(Asn)/glutamyl-tRNA(Gln) amidotransferase subunit B
MNQSPQKTVTPVATLVRGFEVVIGLETHAQLSTCSKIFSTASTEFGAQANTQASPVDLALPGTLPVMNRAAVERAIRFGLAVGAKVAGASIFARKNYFYPDLPKGYQISQYELPVVQGGQVEFFVQGVRHHVNLTRAHLEEDAGKSLHEDYAGQTGIDLNRAGTPLLEIVTEPDMRSSLEAVEYAKALHALVVWLGICDGIMAQGSFRCDANVSVRKPGAVLGTRREIKNLNSFKFLHQAIEAEVQWQIDLIEDGGQVQQATVLFDANMGQTRAMRSKEEAHDYRYFPDPDLPPLVISAQWVAQVAEKMPELPAVMARRFEAQYALPAYDAALITQHQSLAIYFEQASQACQQPKAVANWLMGEVLRRLNAQDLLPQDNPVGATVLAQLMTRIHDGTVSNHGAKQLFELLWQEPPTAQTPALVDQLIEQYSLRQMSDLTALRSLIDQVLVAQPKSVQEFRAGKEKAFNALVGHIMKASQGKANPGQVNALLRERLQ